MNRENVFKYAQKNFHCEPEYLWDNLPGYAVLRHSGSEKWFAIVMNVSGAKLGINMDDEIDVLEVKARPEHIGSLLQIEGILPAYHMSKEHWISVLLSGQVSQKEIIELLTESYKLTS